MGDLNPDWSEDFIKEAFAKFDTTITYVKMVQQSEKNKTINSKDGKVNDEKSLYDRYILCGELI